MPLYFEASTDKAPGSHMDSPVAEGKEREAMTEITVYISYHAFLFWSNLGITCGRTSQRHCVFYIWVHIIV